MAHTITHRAASGARPSAAQSDHIAEELQRYDEHLRDVRGLAAETRKDRIRVVGLLLQHKFGGRAIHIAKLRPDDIRQFLTTKLGANRSASHASHLACDAAELLPLPDHLRRPGRQSDCRHLEPGPLEAGVISARPQARRSRAPAEFLYCRPALTVTWLRHCALRIGHGIEVRRNRSSHDQRHRLACRYGNAAGHKVATPGHPALADGNRAGAGRLSAT